jgi:hypothetical protein
MDKNKLSSVLKPDSLANNHDGKIPLPIGSFINRYGKEVTIYDRELTTKFNADLERVKAKKRLRSSRLQ